MRINRTTVPGNGMLHRIVTRDGEQLCLLVDAASNWHLFTYDGCDRDVPVEKLCCNPTRPTSWPRFCTAIHLQIVFSRWNDGSTN